MENSKTQKNLTPEIETYYEKCFIMNRTKYKGYVFEEAADWLDYKTGFGTHPAQNFTLEECMKVVVERYMNSSKERDIKLYDLNNEIEEQEAWKEVRDYAQEGIYSIEALATDIYEEYQNLKEEMEEYYSNEEITDYTPENYEEFKKECW